MFKHIFEGRVSGLLLFRACNPGSCCRLWLSSDSMRAEWYSLSVILERHTVVFTILRCHLLDTMWLRTTFISSTSRSSIVSSLFHPHSRLPSIDFPWKLLLYLRRRGERPGRCTRTYHNNLRAAACRFTRINSCVRTNSALCRPAFSRSPLECSARH